MTDSTKILTVSYGTFSCTLEGFDDPLNAMRDVAEYFRDLAADDRYFGAEPPTPDVELLQNIAQKEANRRVEARVTETGVALVAAGAATAEPTEKMRADEDTGGPLTFDDDFLMSDEPEDVLAVDPDVVAEAKGPAESVAEKLRRIRAVVSRSVEEEASEAQAHTAPAEAKRDRAQSETIREITADLADDEEAPVEEETPIEVETPIELQAPVESENVAALAENATDDLEGFDAADEHTDTSDEGDATAVASEDNHEAEEDTRDSDEDTILGVLGKVTSRLDEDDETEDEEATIEVSPGATRVVSRTLTPEPEADVGRLMDETDTKLNEDETVRRRRVISQMRAAVAATKADRLVTRQVSREAVEEAEKDPYREDLTEAQPVTELRDPVAEPEDAPLTEREVSSAPPLMLVSSQRVNDEVESAPEETPVVVEAPSADDLGSFADFAQSVGAKELDELLEAAAAYTIFAEGQSSFTRPEIMKRVAHADPTLRMSREDSLRSFGQLLRQGKFRKLDRGQFTVYEDTQYHPTHRYVGE